MSIYKVVAPAGNYAKLNNVNGHLVQANSTAEAKALAKGFSGSDSHAAWADSTATDLTAGAALNGWSFNVHVNTTAHGAVDVTVVGDEDDTLDDVGTKLATALLAAVGVAIAGTAHSAYNTSTNVLTVASAADGIGDKTVTITITPPTGLFESSYVWAQADVVASKVDAGMAAAVLTVTFSTSWVIPSRQNQVNIVS